MRLRVAETWGARDPVFGIRAIAASPSGDRVFHARADRILVREAGATETVGSHGAEVRCLALSPDGRRLLSGGFDKVIRLWDLSRGIVLHELAKHRGTIASVHFLPDGERALSGADRTLRLWDLETGRTIRVFKPHPNFPAVSSLALSPDGALAMAGGVRTVAWWKLDSRQVWRLKLYDRRRRNLAVEPHCAAFLPSGDRVLWGSEDHLLTLTDVATGEDLHVFDRHQSRVVGVACFNERYAVSAASHGAVQTWDLAERTPGPSHALSSEPPQRRLRPTSVWCLTAGPDWVAVGLAGGECVRFAVEADA